MAKKKSVKKAKPRKIKAKTKKKVVRKAKPKKTRSKNPRSAGKSKPKAPQGPEANMEKIGLVTHYFPHVNAAAVKILKNSLKVGDQIYIKGHTTEFKEGVASIQLDHVTVAEGKKGQEIGLLVKSRVRIGDSVYKI